MAVIACARARTHTHAHTHGPAAVQVPPLLRPLRWEARGICSAAWDGSQRSSTGRAGGVLGTESLSLRDGIRCLGA